MHFSSVAHLPWEGIETYRPYRLEALHQRLCKSDRCGFFIVWQYQNIIRFTADEMQESF